MAEPTGELRVLGISCGYHDAAAALIVGDRIVAACEEERFSRRKHDRALPEGAVASCLAIGGLNPDDLDVVVVHEKPLMVASRVLAARQRRGPAAIGAFVREFPTLLSDNVMVANQIDRMLRRAGATRSIDVVYGEHHLSHAAAAFLPSPFDTAAILTMDGIGEWATSTLGQGLRHRVDLLAEQRYPHSLGLVYSLATRWCGFEPNDGEYRLMGLAPFGRPTFASRLAELVTVRDDGSIEVDSRAVRWWGGDLTGRRRLEAVLGGPALTPGEPLTQRHADLARSVQDLTETAVLRMAEHARHVTGERNLCLGGGVALNCAANGRLLREQIFDDVWVQPAAGDSGSAIGAALWYVHCQMERRREVADPPPRGGTMGGAALGPAVRGDEVAAWLAEIDRPSLRISDVRDRCRATARRLADGDVVGWFEGPMEFGPRALGRRSILADPRSPLMQRELNLRVKGRESFRPFAPAVMWEHAADWFDIDRPSPYMSFVYPVAAHRRVEVEEEPVDFGDRTAVARSQIPACTHIDGTARVQTVHPELTPTFHTLLSEFHALTNCPVLLNTSFNRGGEPIVCTPGDALTSAIAGGIDLLVIEDHLIDLSTEQRG